MFPCIQNLLYYRPTRVMEKHNVGDVYGVITPAINENEFAWLACNKQIKIR